MIIPRLPVLVTFDLYCLQMGLYYAKPLGCPCSSDEERPGTHPQVQTPLPVLEHCIAG